MTQKKKKKPLQVLKTIAIILLSLILLFNLYIMIQTKVNPKAVPGFFGYKPFIVLSGSMETEIYVGDLVIVKSIDAKKLKKDDIIAFHDKDDLVVTHRIIDVLEEENKLCFETKGDNNNAPDEEKVCEDKIEGIYKARIPKVGNAIMFIQKPLGFIVMMMSIVIVCMIIYFAATKKGSKMVFESEDERKAFEEFKKSQEASKKE